jgi:hypothetical protein
MLNVTRRRVLYDVSSTLFVRALTVTGVGKELDAIVPTGG